MIRRSTEKGYVVTGRFHQVRRGKTVAFADGAAPETRDPVRRPAKVAVLLALAHRLREAIDEGVVESAAEAARLLGVTRARVTQILDLALLPVAVQEEILFAEAADGREPVTERGLRSGSGLAGAADWTSAFEASAKAASGHSHWPGPQ